MQLAWDQKKGSHLGDSKLLMDIMKPHCVHSKHTTTAVNDVVTTIDEKAFVMKTFGNSLRLHLKPWSWSIYFTCLGMKESGHPKPTGTVGESFCYVLLNIDLRLRTIPHANMSHHNHPRGLRANGTGIVGIDQLHQWCMPSVAILCCQEHFFFQLWGVGMILKNNPVIPTLLPTIMIIINSHGSLMTKPSRGVDQPRQAIDNNRTVTAKRHRFAAGFLILVMNKALLFSDSNCCVYLWITSALPMTLTQQEMDINDWCMVWILRCPLLPAIQIHSDDLSICRLAKTQAELVAGTQQMHSHTAEFVNRTRMKLNEQKRFTFGISSLPGALPQKIFIFEK